MRHLFTFVASLILVESFLRCGCHQASQCFAPDASLEDDLIPALTWGTLNTCSDDNEIDFLRKDISNTSQKVLKRQRRLIYFRDDLALSFEMRYIFPIASINRELKTFISIEFPLTFRSRFPFFQSQEFRKYAGDPSFTLTTFEEMMSNFGLNGRACMNRNICELSSLSPLKPKGIIKDLLSVALKHLFQAYDKTARKNGPASSYLRAASEGRTGARCSSLYPQCSISILGLINFSDFR